MTATEPTTRTLDTPGTTLIYDVRTGGSADEVPTPADVRADGGLLADGPGQLIEVEAVAVTGGGLTRP
jgi:hypothetical protein